MGIMIEGVSTPLASGEPGMPYKNAYIVEIQAHPKHTEGQASEG
jgi:hypothetical protein